jgi:hypothetical protein
MIMMIFRDFRMDGYRFMNGGENEEQGYCMMSLFCSVF